MFNIQDFLNYTNKLHSFLCMTRKKILEIWQEYSWKIPLPSCFILKIVKLLLKWSFSMLYRALAEYLFIIIFDAIWLNADLCEISQVNYILIRVNKRKIDFFDVTKVPVILSTMGTCLLFFDYFSCPYT